MTHWIILLAVETAGKEGGLFDFDATLPLMAIQFLTLALVLNAILYKPLTKAIDDRDDYIRTNQLDARERLSKAEQLSKQYEQDLGAARRKSQTIIADAQAEAQKEAQAQREQAAQEIEQQKQQAMESLEQQVDALSRQILEKLLGSALTGQR